MAKKDNKLVKNDKKKSGESEVVRKFKQQPGLYIGSVLVLVIVAIAFVVPSEVFTGKQRKWDATFGHYDKVPIRWAPDNVFDQFRRQAMNYYQSQGEDLSNPWTMLQIWQQAFEGAVVHNALLQVMRRSNYEVPQKIVNRKVAQNPDLLENGVFSPIRYNRMSEADKLSLWRQTQEDLMKTVYFSDFFDGLLLTNAEAEFIGAMANPQRSFNMVSFDINDYPESEYLAYAYANSQLFDSLHLSKITIKSSEREAKKILDSINAGTISFEEAARTQSQDDSADKGGDMSSKYIYELQSEITSSENQDIVFNLRRGEVSPVLTMLDSSSETNWVIFRAEGERHKADFEDSIVMDKVRSYLRDKDRGRMEDWATEVANEFAARARETSFEAAASVRNLNIRSFGPFPINYSGVELFPGLQSYPLPGFSQNEIGELSRDENFWKIAFSTPVGAPSKPFVQGNNVLVLIPTEEIIDEDFATNAASTYLSYWLYSITEQSIQHYFLNNPRMDNRFMETYFREMMP